MGTRSLTFVYDSYKAKNGRIVYRPIINLYRQYDGYPSGHGQELYDFISKFTLVTGITLGDTRRIANGMGCLAAQLVHHFKGSVGKEENIAMKGHVPTLAGQFYLYPVTAKDCGQDYEYHIYKNADNDVCIRVMDRGCNMFGLTMSDKCETLFEGPMVTARFEKFCKEEA